MENIWEEIKKIITVFFETYPNRKLGFIGGVLIGAIVWTFGFFPTLFAFFCGVIGLYIGSRFDEGDDLKALDKNLPEKFRHWRCKF